MKIQTRLKTFETNSSSIHTLQIMSQEEYDDLMAKENDSNLLWDKWNDEWITVEEVKEKKQQEKYFDEFRYGNYFDYDELEYEVEYYTTLHGDKIVAISKYGYDG